MPKKPADEIPPEEKRSPIGGLAFFISLSALLPSSALVTILAITLFEIAALRNLLVWGAATACGALLAHHYISGHISVLIHEFKHAVASSFAGNKAKGMKVEEHSGHFAYEYTKATGHYNAFISLAPYVLPVFTFLGGLLSLALARTNHYLAISIVGIGYGVDLLLTIRDISPHQTDLSDLRGGYNAGVLYIFGCQLLLAALLATWVMRGGDGLLLLFDTLGLLFGKGYLWLHGGTD